MKFLLLLLVLLVAGVLFFGVGRRRPPGREAKTRPEDKSAARDMVACRQCGLHVPRAEALQGPEGLYCSQAHLEAGGGG